MAIDPVRTRTIARLSATGASKNDIAQAIGTSRQYLHRAMKKPEIQEAIMEETNRLLGCLPDITQQMLLDMETSRKISEKIADEKIGEMENSELIKFQELAYKKQQDVMKALGIYPSGNPSVFVQQFIQNNTNVDVIHPSVMELVNKHLGALMGDGEVVDIEAEDEKEEEEVIPGEGGGDAARENGSGAPGNQ